MKLLLDFNAKVGREDIFKQTIGNERLHKTNNDNGVQKTQLSRVQCSHITKFINTFGLLLMENTQSDLLHLDMQKTAIKYT
jgi:hypothetical protein